MPKAKTTKKKPATRVGGGGVGTRVSKLNLKIVIPIVVLVAALGGFYIFRKSSAGSYTFVRNASQMSGGQYVRKANGTQYVNLTNGYSTSTLAYANELLSANDVCLHYMGIGAASGSYFQLDVSLPDTTLSTGKVYTKSGGSGNICIGNATWNRYKISASGTRSLTVHCYPSCQIDTIYGKY